MVFIISKAGLGMAKRLIRTAKEKHSFIFGDKLVTRAIENNVPVILLVAANDGTTGAHVAKATELNLPVILLSSREEVGELVGVSSAVCCAISFPGQEALIADLLHLG